MKTCGECEAFYFVSEVHSCVNHLCNMVREIVGKKSFDTAKHRLRSDKIKSHQDEHNVGDKTNVSHSTDAGSRLDDFLAKFKVRQGTFE
jgi:hypothetical protein